MNTQQKTAGIFSILHDGTIESWKGDKEKLTLKVSCLYLAKQIDETFEYFYIEILEIKIIEFNAWMNTVELNQKSLLEIKDIFESELEIISAEDINENVLIAFRQNDSKYNYSGGNLIINCKGINIYDHNLKPLQFQNLMHINKQYWEQFGKN